MLSVPDSELDEREEDLSRLHRRMSKKLETLGDELDAVINNLKRKGAQELEDIVDASCKRMQNIVRNEWSCFRSFDSIMPRLDGEMQQLKNRKLKRAVQALSDSGERKLRGCVEEFFGDAETLMLKYLKDFNSRDFVKGLKNKISGLELNGNDSSLGDDENNQSSDSGLLDVICEAIYETLNVYTFGLLNKLGHFISHDEKVREAMDVFNTISNDFDVAPFLERAFGNKDKVLEFIRKSFFDELIEPLQQQLVEIRTKKDDKTKMLSEAQAKVEDLELKKKNISTQVGVIQELKSSLL